MNPTDPVPAYVKRMRLKGCTDDQIRAELEKSAWTGEQIREFLSAPCPPPLPAQASPSQARPVPPATLRKGGLGPAGGCALGAAVGGLLGGVAGFGVVLRTILEGMPSGPTTSDGPPGAYIGLLVLVIILVIGATVVGAITGSAIGGMMGAGFAQAQRMRIRTDTSWRGRLLFVGALLLSAGVLLGVAGLMVHILMPAIFPGLWP